MVTLSAPCLRLIVCFKNLGYGESLPARDHEFNDCKGRNFLAPVLHIAKHQHPSVLQYETVLEGFVLTSVCQGPSACLSAGAWLR